jgi:hypothetical protein
VTAEDENARFEQVGTVRGRRALEDEANEAMAILEVRGKRYGEVTVW